MDQDDAVVRRAVRRASVSGVRPMPPTTTTLHRTSVNLVSPLKPEAPWDEQVQYTDSCSINNLSYCPDAEQLNTLCERGRAAVSGKLYVIQGLVRVKGRDGLTDTQLPLSRSIFFSDGGLKTISLGKGVENSGPFAFIRDHKKEPFTNMSMGLLGVLRTFHGEVYGASRINLFQGKTSFLSRQTFDSSLKHKDQNRVREMLVDFIRFRDAHISELLAETVAHMSSGPKTMTADYTAVRDMFSLCADAKVWTNTGLGVLSFCQAWVVDAAGKVTNVPSFSVACPHFQTRFYIRDGQRLRLFLADKMKNFTLVDAMLKSYNTVVIGFSKSMQYAGYKKAFVNVDALKKQMGDGSF